MTSCNLRPERVVQRDNLIYGSIEQNRCRLVVENASR